MLQFEHVTRKYGKRTAVDDFCLEVKAGELFALLGHNGAGKTTTIKTLVGLLKPTSGAVRVGPFNVVEQRREASRLVGYVPDQPFLYDKLTGREFLHFVATMYGFSESATKAAIERESERFQLMDFIDRLTESYSHGMRQRTVFAAALIHQPQVLVVDEPMVGLDPQSIRLVKDLLCNYVKSGKTVFMSTHTLNVAEEIADRLGVMRAGHKLFEGRVDELRALLPESSHSLESLYLAMMEVDEIAQAAPQATNCDEAVEH